MSTETDQAQIMEHPEGLADICGAAVPSKHADGHLRSAQALTASRRGVSRKVDDAPCIYNAVALIVLDSDWHGA